MAVKEVRHCDVFESYKDVENYSVTIISDEAEETILDVNVDLCPRGLKRLKKFVKDGVTKPSEKGKGKEADDAGTEQEA
jgi:hypothetical protein